MNEIKVSVIIPVYNVGEYISKCINSVINQTYDNIEIIIIDDYSTDNSGIICDEFKEKYKEIILIHNEKNEGVSYCRNKGIELSTGEYILFVDGDDYIDSTLVEKVVKKIFNEKEKHIVDTVCYGFQTVDENYNELSTEDAILWPETYIEKDRIFDEVIGSMVVSKEEVEYWFSHQEKSYYETIHKNKKMGSCWRFLLSKDIIKKNNISFKKEIRRGQDIVFMISYLLCSQGMTNIEGYLYKYVQRMTSTMHTYVDVQKKISLIEGMDQTVSYAPEGKEELLRNKWRGQRLLAAMNSARFYARECGYVNGFKLFRLFADHKINRDAYRNISLKDANIKYKIAAGMMKMHMFLLFYISICITVLFKKDMSPMD